MNSNLRSEAKPFIRLSGEWLRALGLEIGSSFQLEVTDNKIIIQQTKEEDA